MKGGLAAMVYAVKALLDAGVELAGNLYVVGVVQEEPCEGLAMQVLVEEEGIHPDYVVLGEPSNLHVRIGHRGRMEMEVNVRSERKGGYIFVGSGVAAGRGLNQHRFAGSPGTCPHAISFRGRAENSGPERTGPTSI